MSGDNTTQPQTPSDPAPILGADPAKPAVDPAAPAVNPAAAPAKPVIPEKYEFKAPEGQKLDALQLDSYSPLFKELGLTQEQAQKLVDKQFELAPKLAEHWQKEIATQIAQETATWAKASREDKEFGGAQFDVSAKIANQALAAFGDQELRQVLKESGYANHPAFVRMLWKVGKQLAEDKPPTTGDPGGKPPPEKGLYPSMNS